MLWAQALGQRWRLKIGKACSEVPDVLLAKLLLIPRFRVCQYPVAEQQLRHCDVEQRISYSCRTQGCSFIQFGASAGSG